MIPFPGEVGSERPHVLGGRMETVEIVFIHKYMSPVWYISHGHSIHTYIQARPDYISSCTTDLQRSL